MKEKRQLFILGALLLIAAGAWYWGSGARAIAPKLAAVQKLTYTPLGVENPGLHREKLEASRRTEYKGSGRDLFSESAPPPPVASQVTSAPQPVQQATTAPPPPPLPTLPPNMKFFGYGTVPNGTSKRAFLTDGEQVFIVSEGDTLLGRYRIVRIGNANLDFEDISTGLRNSVTLQETPS
jgi:hypothetical protein